MATSIQFDSFWENSQSPPHCIGAGLLALDVLVEDEVGPWHSWAGGSCGNVMAILAYLGWSTSPVARLGLDLASTLVTADLKQWGVSMEFISRSTKVGTPVVVQRLDADNGEHRFSFRCPSCRNWLPQFRAFVKKSVPTITHRVPAADVYYFDRATPAAIDLASYYHGKGAIVMFEPPRLKDDGLTDRALQFTTILKLSSEKENGLAGATTFPAVIIETRGKSGLRYRFHQNPWQELRAKIVHNLVDAAGSGDWCSAGLLNHLLLNAWNPEDRAAAETLHDGLKIGQALSTLNCYYKGARGPMNSLHREQFMAQVTKIMAGRSPLIAAIDGKTPTVDSSQICTSCEERLKSEIQSLVL